MAASEPCAGNQPSRTACLRNSSQTLQASGTATILADGRVLVVGGSSYSDEIYDPTSGTFSFVFTRTAGARPTATLLKDGRVLIVGGDFLLGPGLYQP